MPIGHFKVLQSVLSQTRDVICDVYGLSKEEAFARAEAFIKDNSERWKLADPGINYGDPFCRMAYLYMNVAIHASLVEHAMRVYPQIGRLMREKARAGEELRVCALGGGPGSELLGLVRYAESAREAESTTYVDFVLVDLVKEWDESWHALKAGVDERLRQLYGNERRHWPVVTSRSFLALNATSPADFEHFATRFGGTDLFLVCYLVSELKASAAGFEAVLDLLAKRAKPGALFLFIDRNEREVRTTIQQMVERNPLLTLLDIKESRGRLEENMSDLGEWYIHIPSLPRQKWLAFFALVERSGTDTHVVDD